MLHVAPQGESAQGALWLTFPDSQKWNWIVQALPQLVREDLIREESARKDKVHDDLNISLDPRTGLQKSSDLELSTLPLHMMQVPAGFFFPFVTYAIGTGFSLHLTIAIPTKPLNKITGRNWLLNWSGFYPLSLVSDMHRGETLTWSNATDSSQRKEMDYTDIMRRAAEARTYLFDEIRYVYDETASVQDGSKTSTLSRYQFPEELVEFATTKEYLKWYIDKFNNFINRLIAVGKPDAADREKCLVAGWTLNRLAVDAFTILSTDAPYLRKWQFFGFLDALAALQNELDGTGHKDNADSETAKSMLTKHFCTHSLLPVIGQIPFVGIRDAVTNHTQEIYKAIDQLGNKRASGPDLLWLYRNSRHGYTLRNKENRRQLVKHDGSMPNDLPDLTIALWHYVLLQFPFTDVC